MSILRLLLPLLVLPLATALAQEVEPPDGATITAIHVSGFDIRRLSSPLQQAIGKLEGTALNRRQLGELAARIEIEFPNHVAGVRASQEPGGGARVIFVVAEMRDQERAANINSRYVVEDVRIRGVSERELDQPFRDDLNALEGRQLDADEADRLESRLRKLFDGYDISRRTIRGSQPGQIILIWIVNRPDWARWLRFEPQDANLVYHSDQGWGARLPLSIGARDVHVTPIVAIDIGDELIEEYGGFGVRVESRRLGTERLGAFFEWSTFDQTWRDATQTALQADSRVPALYRNRMTVTPIVKFAITRQLSLAGGVRITELDPLADSDEPARMANAAVASLSFSQRPRETSGPRHGVEASVVLRAGTAALESDLVFERYVGHAGYSFKRSSHLVLLSGMAGRIDGDAPLFERFSLGDSRTLRGWDKYDIAPLGGDRMVHASLEYQYQGFGMFLDAGSVWDGGADRRVRISTGVTAHPGPVFFTVGFPLNTEEFRAVFTMGIRFSSSRIAISKY